MRYTLLQKQNTTPRTPMQGAIKELLTPAKRGQLWAVDFETRGLLPWSTDFQIVTLGMADQDGCFAIDWRTLNEVELAYVLKYLQDSKLIAFNAYFDAGALQKYDKRFPWVGDAYALFKALSTEGAKGQSWNLDTAINDVLGWQYNSKVEFDGVLAKYGIKKADLWTLPHSELAPYCAGDADATWQLWQYLSGLNSTVTEYHLSTFMPQVRLLLEQAWNGMVIDRDLLIAGHTQLRKDMLQAEAAFFTAPGVASYRLPEPPKLTKTGKVSAAWTKWDANKSGVNINSKQQLADLFFRHLGKTPIKFTPSGRPQLNKKVLPALGDEGRALAKYNKMKKQDGYVKKVVALSENGFIRPTFNTVGTATLRPSGTGGFNMLQMPKVPGLLAAFVARPGHKLVQADMEALEPTILAQCSQDTTLLSIYGADAKPNDIYLYVASKIPALGREILKYYDPDNPTPEGIALAKKHCKRERQIAKVVQLSSAYGAGAKKIHETLRLDGVDITLNDVTVIHAAYWRLFRGVKRFGYQLEAAWQASGGYIPSMIGTPICVDASRTKDLVNRFCQTSASLILQYWVAQIDREVRECGIPAVPWNVNFYDETVWEVPAGYAEQMAGILVSALHTTNAVLQVSIPFKAPPMIADNLAEIKCGEEYKLWKEARDATQRAS